MKKFVKTSEIYSKAEWLMVELSYQKGVGYVVTVTPVQRTEFSFSVVYNSEYFNYYKAIRKLIISCGRKSAKKEEEATEIFIKNFEEYIKEYCEYVVRNGGNKIEIKG